MEPKRFKQLEIGLAAMFVLALALVFGGFTGPVTPALAAPGVVLQTPVTPMEEPIEVEIELSPAGSLKQAPLWKEMYQLLTNPNGVTCTDPADPTTCTATIVRRPSFTATPMPALNVWALDYNYLTGQPMRLRTSDGEVSLDQPGPLFDPGQSCLVPGTLGCNEFNTPIQLRTIIGHLVACPDTPPYQSVAVPASVCAAAPAGSLVVYNTTGSGLIPPTGTVVAVPAVLGGLLQELAGTSTTTTVDLAELEIPVNEEDFFRTVTDVTNVPAALRPYIGRPGAEVLGKALFWDMQVGSDGVQACASCHFHAGVDNRSRNQLNPNHIGGDFDLEVTSVAGSPTTNVEVVASDFTFHKLADPNVPGEGAGNAVLSTANDVMSSMGVSRFTQFVDIPPIGIANFLPAVSGVRALAPDLGTPLDETTHPAGIPIMAGVRRIEPRNTPTFHNAAFNFDNFWDGRARFTFNGGSVFGASDPTAHIFINPGLATGGGGEFVGATMGHIRPDLLVEDPAVAPQPVRIKFSSLASQSVGPPLSEFEMSFLGRNWAKIGKKLLQGDQGNIENQGNGAPQQPGTNRVNAVAPLANQLVAVDDSRLGPFSNQGGSVCSALGRPTAVGKPGLCISYPDLIRVAFARQFWNRNNRHLNGAAGADPFDGFVLTVANGAANPNNTNQFTQMEANFSAFFGLSVQAYESLTISDDSPWDQVNDLNPFLGQAVGEPADQAVLFPTLITDLLADGVLNGTTAYVNLVPGFGPDEVFGFDMFAGANLTAALAPGASVGESGRDRNPVRTIQVPFGAAPETQTPLDIQVGSNPFTRSAKCMMCHLGPEQTDHSISVAHGLLKLNAEFEFPTPPYAVDPNCIFGVDPVLGFCVVPAPEPSGNGRFVPGLILADEVEEAAQDAVEVEPRNFATIDHPETPWDDRIIAQQGFFAFGDQGIYNIGLRPITEDIGRGGNDPFGKPLSLATLALQNIAGEAFVPGNPMPGVDPENLGLTFDETGGGVPFPGTPLTLQSINPGLERSPSVAMLPPYMAPWVGGGMPAGELHPQIDEMAGLGPNIITPPNGGPGIEFPEVLFGADFHCGRFDPAVFGNGPPNFGWGPIGSNVRLCPQNQSGVSGNFDFPIHGTWPVPNRVLRDGAFKAPALRNVELTGPYFHTGSFLTLRQVVDFYFRGGDFNVTNAENRDPNIMDLFRMTSAYGPSNPTADAIGVPFDCSPDAPNVAGFPLVAGGCGDFSYLIGTFVDGLPDTVFQFDEYPDSDHPVTPEPVFASRAEALEDAKNSIVKFMIALTDARVKFERAPFDHPELFVPIDGAAPENAAGRGTVPVAGATDLVSLSGVACPAPGPGSLPTVPCFRQIAAVGAAGNVGPDLTPGTADDVALPAFLGVTNIPPGQLGFNCSAGGGAVSHFCPTINP